ncbi:class I SAM-dependent methyltransferase [Pseudogracilibacillus sp. SE30717A]|uniref:class I SAM-dependent methyltransferase n=1 Tax=Pseudogracilibacillus sp. SE30717A TaxID=3098293 RepID=UPI00300E55AE
MIKEKWDSQFSQHPFTYGKKVNNFIKEKSGIFPANSSIACFAEGEGRNAIYLAKLGHSVTTYDISPIGLQNTTILAKENGVSVKTKESDLTKMKTQTGKYDGAIMVFGHVEHRDQEFFIKNIINSVSSEGYVMLEVYSKQQLNYDTGGPGKEPFLYNPADMLQWIAPYTCIHFYYGEVTREEGYRHTGIGHVIQVIIRK